MKQYKAWELLPEEKVCLTVEVYKAIAELKDKNRRLQLALWMARALRARDIQRWWISATCAPITERACSVWNNVERKCRAKAEEYR